MSELNAFRTELLTDSRNEANLSNGEDSEVSCYTKRALAFIDSTEELGGFPHDCHALGQRSDKSKWRIDGYCIESIDVESKDGGYETLSIFVTVFDGAMESKRMTKAAFERAFKEGGRFVSDAMKGYMSEELDDASPAKELAVVLSRHRKNIERVRLHLVTDIEVDHDLPETSRVRGFDDVPLIFRVWDIRRLHEISISEVGRKPIVVDFVRREGSAISCLAMPSENSEYKCYLAILQGDVLANLYQEFGTRLLESNVRSFLQQTGKVNKGIRDTIRAQPGRFLPYNNGLAATGSSLKIVDMPDGGVGIAEVQDLQVVNGGQTTASLYHTRKKFNADLSDVYVQMKLTVLTDPEQFVTVVPKIAEYSNSQNKVKLLDLRSNSPFLMDLEKVAQSAFAPVPGRPSIQSVWYFERVNGGYREKLNSAAGARDKRLLEEKFPKTQKLDKAAVFKYMNLFEGLPHIVSRGSQKNGLAYLAKVDSQFAKLSPGPTYWKTVVGCGILVKRLEKIFGTGDKSMGESGTRSFTVSYTASLFHARTDGRMDFESLWKLQSIPEVYTEILTDGLRWVYKKLLKNAFWVEAAKKEPTWKDMLDDHSDPFVNFDWDNLLWSEIESKKWRKSWSKQQTGADEELLSKISAPGLQFWNGACLLGARGKLESRDYNMAQRIRKSLTEGKVPSNSQLKRASEIIGKLHDAGFSDGDVNALAGGDKVDFDLGAALSRVRQLGASDWNLILGFEDYLVPKSVVSKKEWQGLRTSKSKLEKNEDPPLPKLKQAINCLDAINKKFRKSF